MNPIIAALVQMLAQQASYAGSRTQQASGGDVSIQPTQGGTANLPALVDAISSLAQANSTPPQPAKMPAVASVLAFMVTLAFCGTLGCVLWASLFQHGTTADPALWLLLGVLASSEITILGFYFGSSLGAWFSRTATGQGGPLVALPPVPLPTPTLAPLPLPPPAAGPGPALPEPSAAAQDNFPRCLTPILKWEGGYSNDPGDSGGPTNMGITQADLSNWLGRQASIADVKSMTLEIATAIYRKRYWEPLLCDQLPVSLALMTFNCGVNSGVSRGASFLQRTLNRQNAGLDEDGEVGPLTVAAAAKVDVKQAVIDYASIYEAYYRGLGNFGMFGRGWLDRLSDIKGIALGWTNERGPVAPPAALAPTASVLPVGAKRPSGYDIVALARKHIGERYVNVLVPKDDSSWKGPWDCAEFASWLVYQVAGVIYGCTNDSDPPHVADAYTGAWQSDAKTKGKMVSISEATGTPGAFLLRYPPAPGEMGHIVVSDGQGGTVEAAGTATGVVAGKVSGRRWDTGVLVPGIDYTAGSHIAVSGPAVVYAVGQPNMDAAKVTAIQNALAGKGFSPGEIDGEYGQNTALAVVAFQQAQGLIADGEVGMETAAALGVSLS